MMMTKALGYQPDITRHAFEHECFFTTVLNVRKLLQDSTSATSTRSGDLVRVERTNFGTGAGAVTGCSMTLISFGVVAIRESGVTLLT